MKLTFFSNITIAMQEISQEFFVPHIQLLLFKLCLIFVSVLSIESQLLIYIAPLKLSLFQLQPQKLLSFFRALKVDLEKQSKTYRYCLQEQESIAFNRLSKEVIPKKKQRKLLYKKHLKKVNNLIALKLFQILGYQYLFC